jgi:hypothetical protein
VGERSADRARADDGDERHRVKRRLFYPRRAQATETLNSEATEATETLNSEVTEVTETLNSEGTEVTEQETPGFRLLVKPLGKKPWVSSNWSVWAGNLIYRQLERPGDDPRGHEVSFEQETIPALWPPCPLR